MAIVRFPNDLVGVKFQSFDESKFIPDKKGENETFGWYDRIYVAVSNK